MLLSVSQGMEKADWRPEEGPLSHSGTLPTVPGEIQIGFDGDTSAFFSADLDARMS